MASFSAFFQVGNKEYTVLYSNLNIHQFVDDLVRPASPTFGGATTIEIDVSTDPTIPEWMFNPAAFKNAQLLLRNLTGGVEKVIKYYNAYCVGLTQSFDGTANASNFRWRFRLAPQAIAVGGLFHDNNWPAPEPIVDWDWSEMDAACHPERAVKAVQEDRTIQSTNGSVASLASVKSIAPVKTVVDSDCSESVRMGLQRDVTLHCKGTSTKCFNVDSCPTLEGKMETINSCIKARTTINMKCFKGGDAGHKQAVEEKINSLINCQSIFFQKCGSEKVPVPSPQRVPAPTPPVIKPDPDFMKKMEELTGLTGAALILYIIISEGSRLFPPRNVIPIP